MTSFDFAAPTTLDETIALLADRRARARVLCGGTDLIVQLREHRRELDLVIDVKRIPELQAVTYDRARGLTLGAAVPCARIYQDPTIARVYPGLVDAASLIGGIQIQNRASLGGNLCNSSPAADSVPALIVHRAVCRIAGPAGIREVPVEDFCAGPGRNVLEADELLVSLLVPTPPPSFGAAYLRFIPRNEMDIAVVGCGAAVEINTALGTFQSARIALGAVAPTPLLVRAAAERLIGRSVGDAAIEEAARAAQAACRPISDMRGSADYRRHLAGVLTRRAVRRAVERARGAL